MGKVIMVDFTPEFRAGLRKFIEDQGVTRARQYLVSHSYDPSFIEVVIKSITKPKVAK